MRWDRNKPWILLNNAGFCSLSKWFDLGLGLETKRTEEDTIWDLIILEVIITRLDIIVELRWVVTDFETVQVVTALIRERICKINNVLLLKSEKDIKREKALLFFLYFLLVTREKATSASSVSIVILILEEDIGTRLEP